MNYSEIKDGTHKETCHIYGYAYMHMWSCYVLYMGIFCIPKYLLLCFTQNALSIW